MEFTWWLSVLVGYWNKLTDCVAYKQISQFWRLKSEIRVPAQLGEGPLLGVVDFSFYPHLVEGHEGSLEPLL